MLNNTYACAYKCVHRDICIYSYIYSSSHLYMGYIPMNTQDTHDRLFFSSNDTRKQISISFTWFPQKGFPGSKLTGKKKKRKEKKALYQTFWMCRRIPIPCLILKLLFPSKRKRMKKHRNHVLKKWKQKREKLVRVRSVNHSHSAHKSFPIGASPGYKYI